MLCYASVPLCPLPRYPKVRRKWRWNGLFLPHSRTRPGGDGQGTHMTGWMGGRDRTGWVAVGRDRTDYLNLEVNDG